MTEWKKFLIVTAGLLEILIFGGTILGWTSLKEMLKNEGIYDYLCHQQVFNNSSGNFTETEFPAKNETIPKISPKFALKVNFTFVVDDDNNIPGENPRQTSLVIPFESPGKTYNETFIYRLLNNSMTFRTDSGSDDDDSTAINLQPANGTSPSMLERYLDLFLREQLELSSVLDSNDHIQKGCNKQDITLNLAFSIGSFCMGAAAFIWGFLLQKLGLRIVRLIINGMFLVGALLLCFIARGRDWLLFPAMLIMSLSGVPIRIANMQISNLYPSKRSTIISLYSGAFSASSIIYVILQNFYTQWNVSFFWIQFVLVALSVLTIPFSFILPSDRVREGTWKEPSKKICDKHHDVQLEEEKKFSHKIFSQKSMDLSISKSKSSVTLQNFKPVKSPRIERKNGFLNHAYIPDVMQQEPVKPEKLSPATSEKELEKIPLPETPPLGISLWSFAYNLHQLWFSWMITYMVMYVGSLDLWTKRTTNDESSRMLLLKTNGMVQVLALVISPVAGLLMDWQLSRASRIKDPMERRVRQIQAGFWPLFITSSTLLLCVLCRYFDRQEFIYLSIAFVTIYRSFLLAVGSAFLRIRFHPNHFNQLLGIMSSVSAVISLLQIPLFIWEKSNHGNDAIYVNMVNTAIAVLIMTNPLYLLITPLQRYFVRKEEEQLLASTKNT